MSKAVLRVLDVPALHAFQHKPVCVACMQEIQVDEWIGDLGIMEITRFIRLLPMIYMYKTQELICRDAAAAE